MEFSQGITSPINLARQTVFLPRSQHLRDSGRLTYLTELLKGAKNSGNWRDEGKGLLRNDEDFEFRAPQTEIKAEPPQLAMDSGISGKAGKLQQTAEI